jgi:hypothetical protein
MTFPSAMSLSSQSTSAKPRAAASLADPAQYRCMLMASAVAGAQ